ncbi:YtxH domain-containing protein [Rhodococcus tibetensis]|uniref:YtxH domain-containing protein n=1 Tax=Rhodococcus tibetensis TaxID=2965064 RepID=A0ABT1QEV7_9NOCA|nr:YtxH domain-containing protein [Rhodococcus sp. FXJ9.536]MCQ4120798.1 YtxH domain-containing protein [Rhodococcus sp. FXJ9.536]
MERALIFVAGAAVGFVLGARSGRQTYEKMREQSLEVWHNPAVQEKVSGATETVKDKAPQVQHKVGELAKKATHRGTDTNSAAAATTGVPRGDATAPTPAATDSPVSPPPSGKHTQSPN